MYNVKCVRCSHEWAPNPNKWRNTASIEKGLGKVLFCPVCLKANQLSPLLTENIIRTYTGYRPIKKLRGLRRGKRGKSA